MVEEVRRKESRRLLGEVWIWGWGGFRFIVKWWGEVLRGWMGDKLEVKYC
jgi:hypothetical protein